MSDAKKPAFLGNLADLSETGFFFCLTCQQITDPTDEQGQRRCGHGRCRSYRVKWCPPVRDIAPVSETEKVYVKDQHRTQTNWDSIL